MQLGKILKEATEKKASDIIFKVGSPICMRINGELFKQGEVLSEKDLDLVINEIMDESHKPILKEDKEAVLSFGMKDIGRFRATVFQQRGTLVVVIRAVNSDIPDFDELNLPTKVLEKL